MRNPGRRGGGGGALQSVMGGGALPGLSRLGSGECFSRLCLEIRRQTGRSLLVWHFRASLFSCPSRRAHFQLHCLSASPFLCPSVPVQSVDASMVPDNKEIQNGNPERLFFFVPGPVCVGVSCSNWATFASGQAAGHVATSRATPS